MRENIDTCQYNDEDRVSVVNLENILEEVDDGRRHNCEQNEQRDHIIRKLEERVQEETNPHLQQPHQLRPIKTEPFIKSIVFISGKKINANR